jgi:hypothetical protein
MSAARRLRRTAVLVALALLAVCVAIVMALGNWPHGLPGLDVFVTIDGAPLHVQGVDSASLPLYLGAVGVALLLALLVPLGLLFVLLVLLLALGFVALVILLPAALVLLPLLALLGFPLVLCGLLLRWLWRRSDRRADHRTTMNA